MAPKRKKPDPVNVGSNSEEGSMPRKNLVIVESAAKAKTIQKYLNEIPELARLGAFSVKASFGHIDNLPGDRMAVDTESWTAEYVPLDDKRKVITELRGAVRDADFVYLASDNDLEGECIASHLRDMFRLTEGRAARITFNEITKPALRAAVEGSRWIDTDKVAAQEARRIMDRVVGYELSPLLWRRFPGEKKGLSAGRVQSAALRMIVDRARAAKEHKPEPFWTLMGVFQAGDGGLHDLPAKADEKWTDPDEVEEVLKAVASPDVQWQAAFSKKIVKQTPSAPFTTSTLQQEAYNRLGLSAKDTMRYAQGLYEAGKITYMRTDSTAMAEEAAAAIRGFVGDEYGAGDVQPRVYKTRATNAQEAHEAIRPTQPALRAADLADGFTGTARKLYDLIWRRAVASQMAAAIYHEVHYNITATAAGEKRIPVFKGKTSVLVSEGYLRVYSPDQKAVPDALSAWEGVAEKEVPVSAVSTAFRGVGDVTRVIGLYNEPALVKALEKAGIGRPSTYAGILDKLHSKGYVSKGMNPQVTVRVKHFGIGEGGEVLEEEETLSLGGKDTDRLVPSGLGERVTEYLMGSVPFLLDTAFTAGMEAELDRISARETSKKAVLDAFYHDKFHPVVEAANAERETVRRTKAKANHGEKKKKKEKDKEKDGCSADNVLKDFSGLGNVKALKTRFGPALCIGASGAKKKATFVSLAPFMEWQGKTIEDITDTDVAFLLRLPLSVPGTTRVVALGRYGLYVKDGDTNLPLKKELWDRVFNGTITADELNGAKWEAKPGAKPYRKFAKRGVAKP